MTQTRFAHIIIVGIPMLWLLSGSMAVQVIAMACACLGVLWCCARAPGLRRDITWAARRQALVIGYAAFAALSLAWSRPQGIDSATLFNPVLIGAAMLAIPLLTVFLQARLTTQSARPLARAAGLGVGALLVVATLELVVLQRPLLGGAELCLNGRLALSSFAVANPNAAAPFFTLSALAGLWLTRQAGRSDRWMGAATVGLSALFLGACGSVALAVGAVLGFAFWAVAARSGRVLLMLGLLVAGMLLGDLLIGLLCGIDPDLARRPLTWRPRLMIWQQALAQAQDHWLIGQGFFTVLLFEIDIRENRLVTHSLLLHQALAGGMIAALWVTALAAQTLTRAGRAAVQAGAPFALAWLIAVAPALIAHKHMAFLLDGYLWVVVWGPILAAAVSADAPRRGAGAGP